VTYSESLALPVCQCLLLFKSSSTLGSDIQNQGSAVDLGAVRVGVSPESTVAISPLSASESVGGSKHNSHSAAPTYITAPLRKLKKIRLGNQGSASPRTHTLP
jgi:hypothetical protein